MKAVLVDGYIDEPAALGVPPYISPYIRYTYGALLEMGADVRYITIDEIRSEREWKFDADLLVIYGGTTVPGHYLSGTPITLFEVNKLLEENSHAIRVVSGPISLAYTIRGGSVAILPKFDAEYVVRGDVWAFFPKMENTGARDDYDLIRRVSISGASLLKDHPFFPNVVCEIEVSRGCERSTYCSFCTEPILHGKMKSRPVEDIVEEVKALYKSGCRAFRLGRSANIIAYMSELNGGKPSPQAVKDLYSGIRSVAPNLEVLHTDNANPSYIVRNEKEASKVIEIIAKYDTPGDVLSFGAESFDEKVLKENNIGSSPEEVRRAIEIVNEIGGFRVDGIPKLLPGINLLYGLPGESEKTYEKNYGFLKKVLEDGLLLRRINIRQVMVYPGTKLWRMKWKVKTGKRYKFWKERIRKEIDLPMMKRVFPVGAILRGVIPEKRKGKITFGRQLGSYPVLLGTYSEFREKSDFVVVDHGPRSVTGVKIPIDINSISLEELSSINGIGKKRAEEILLKRPFRNIEDLKRRISEEIYEIITKFPLKMKEGYGD